MPQVVGTKRDLNSKVIGQPPLDKTETELKDTEVAASMAIDEMALPGMDRSRADGDYTDI